MPHWINLSFYSKNQRVGYNHFKSRINIPRRTEAQIRQNRQSAQITNIKHEDHVSNSNDVSGGATAIDVYELSDNYIKRKMSDPELSLMHTVASSSSADLDCIIGG